MYKEKITDKEGICLLTLFVMGSSLILGVGGSAKNDAWIAAIVGIIMFLPLMLIYSRIQALLPGRCLFEIINIAFGKIFGKIVAVLYIWYTFHLGALVMRNFGEFVDTVALPETLMVVTLLFLGVVCIYAVRMGIEVMARISTYFIPIVMFIIFVVYILSIPQYNFSNIKPILSEGFTTVLNAGFSVFSFPFAETFVFLGVFYTLKSKKSPYKVYFTGIMMAGIVIIFLTIRNIGILGSMLEYVNFPSHVAVSRVSVTEFLQRIEVSVAFVFVVCAFTKVSVCLYIACRGIGKLFNLNDYGSIVIQVGLLMTYFSFTVYDNIMEMMYFAYKVYNYYAFPFQVVIPVIMWLIIEVKVKKGIKV